MSSYGDPPASSVSAALTTKALSEPQFARRLVETAIPRSTRRETACQERDAGRSSQSTSRLPEAGALERRAPAVPFPEVPFPVLSFPVLSSPVLWFSHFISQMLGRSPTTPAPHSTEGVTVSP